MKLVPFAAAVVAICVAAMPAWAGKGDMKLALEVAQAEVSGGYLLLARPEAKGTKGGFYFWIQNRVVEIEVRISDRKVILIKDVEEIRDSPVPVQDVVAAFMRHKGAKIPFTRIMEAAEETSPGSDPVGVEVTIIAGRPVFKVDLDAAPPVNISVEGRPIRR